MIDYTLVVDVWEAETGLDYAALMDNGVGAVIIRLNDMNGGHHMDANFAAQWKLSADAGMTHAPYFVYNPWVTGQANFDWLKANLPVGYGGRVFADIEVAYANYPPATYAAEVKKFISLLQVEHPTTIYTGQWFLPYLSSWPLVEYWWAQYLYAVYPTPGITTTWDWVKTQLASMPQKPTNSPSCPGPITMWQVSGDRLALPGSPKPIDVNCFYGNQVALENWIGDKSVVIPPVGNNTTVSVKEVRVGTEKVPSVVTVDVMVNGVLYTQNVDQTIPVPPVAPPVVAGAGLYRVRHDIERHNWGYKSRLWQPGWKKLRGLPETVRIGGGKSTVSLSPAWAKYVEDLHCAIPGKPTPTEQKRINYVKALQSGWVNYGPWPKVEQLTFGGNLVEVTRVEGDKAFIKSYYNDQVPPKTCVNTLVQTFSVGYTDGSWEMATPVGLVRTIIIANPGEELWMALDDLVKI